MQFQFRISKSKGTAVEVSRRRNTIGRLIIALRIPGFLETGTEDAPVVSRFIWHRSLDGLKIDLSSSTDARIRLEKAIGVNTVQIPTFENNLLVFFELRRMNRERKVHAGEKNIPSSARRIRVVYTERVNGESKLEIRPPFEETTLVRFAVLRSGVKIQRLHRNTEQPMVRGTR